jgi:hypothetical protein
MGEHVAEHAVLLSVNQVVCLYFMGLNISNEQIAQELALNGSDVHQMTTQLRAGIIKKSRP